MKPPKFKVGSELRYVKNVIGFHNINRRLKLGESAVMDCRESCPTVRFTAHNIDGTHFYYKREWGAGFFEEELELINKFRDKLLKVVKND